MAPKSTVADVLRTEGIKVDEARGIAVARNDTIVRRAEWADTHIDDGDTFEIVTARQGG